MNKALAIDYSGDIPEVVLASMEGNSFRTGGVPTILSVTPYRVDDTHVADIAREVASGDSAVILPNDDTMSVEVILPFRDGKMVRQVLLQELQDNVPFELSEFSVSYQYVGQTAEGESRFRALLAPRAVVQAAIYALETIGNTPRLVTAKGTALALAALKKCGELAAKANAIMIVEEDVTSILWLENGRLRDERHFQAQVSSNLVANGGPVSSGGPGDSPEQELACSLEVWQRACGAEKPLLVLIGAVQASDLSTDIRNGWQIEHSRTSLSRAEVAAWTAVATADDALFKTLPNFRVADLAYRPNMKPLWEGILKLRWLAAAALVVALILPLGIYLSRSLEISRIQNEMRDTATRRLPGASINPGQELSFVLGENRKLSSLLEDLGSPVYRTPLDILAEISADQTLGGTTVIKKFSVRGLKVRIEGTVQSTTQKYDAVERLQRAFKAKRKTFCRVQKETNSSASGVSFVFTIDVCEH